jgi:uncharacterized protein (DUF58 family)
MWKNFLLSIALLAVALMAALYSSSVANDGRIVAAGISAVFSLVLSIWVGFRFVPRLAKGVKWNWIPGLAHYKLTKDGAIFMAAVVVVVIAAINTSNNLLYMILSVLISVFVLSVFLLELNFKFLDALVTLPHRCTVGEAFSFSIQIFNRRRVFPMISLRVEPPNRSALKFEPFYFAAIDPLTHAKLPAESVLSRRGRYSLSEVQVASRFPFGLLSKRQIFKVEGETVCYPAILSRDRLNFSALDDQGSIQRMERGSGNDLHTIRDYQSSDSARHVHWKASAKTASLKTREYAADESRRVVLVLDRFGTAQDSERFEELVTHAASLAFHCIHDGADVELVSDEWRSPTGSMVIVLAEMMEYLATVEMAENAALPDVDSSRGAMLLSLRQRHG